MFTVWDSGFRVQGWMFQISGFEVKSLFRIEVLQFRVQGLGFKLQGLGFGVQGPVFRIQGSGFRV